MQCYKTRVGADTYLNYTSLPQDTLQAPYSLSKDNHKTNFKEQHVFLSLLICMHSSCMSHYKQECMNIQNHLMATNENSYN